jgi:acid phosphatase
VAETPLQPPDATPHQIAASNHVQAAADHAYAQDDRVQGRQARATLVAALPATPRSRIAYGLAGIALLGIGLGAGLSLANNHAAAPAHRSVGTEPHVLIVMEENRGYSATLGTCSADPYLCSLAASYASETDWWGVRHPSEPNYIAVTTGGTQGCSSDTCFKTLTVPSIGGQLTAAGVPWTAYMESMPSPCYTKQWYGGVDAGALYGEKHDPFVVEGDVLKNGCATHVLPYPGASSLVSKLDASGAPDFVWITPNQQDDMHTGSVQKGDAWLKANLAPVLTSSWFTNFPSTIVVTEDEGTGKGDCCGDVGGQIPMVIISNNAQGSGNLATAGDHYSTLRALEEVFGLSTLGSATKASNIVGLFG